MPTEAPLNVHAFRTTFTLELQKKVWNVEENKNPICCNSTHTRIPLQVCLWLITAEVQGKN